MPVVITNTNSAFMSKLGVSAETIQAMKSAGIKLSLGFKDFTLLSENNVKLVEGKFAADTSALMKGTADASAKSESLAAMVKGIEDALAVCGSVLKKSDLSGIQIVTPKPMKVVPGVPKAKAPNGDVIPLNEATAMYQRVFGSSGGSVYVVVALGSGIKVAARVHGGSIAVRAEGNLTSDIREKLESQMVAYKGISKKGHEYASGHFNFSDDAPPSKVLGAVLLGTGIQFETVLPDMDKVKSLCS